MDQEKDNFVREVRNVLFSSVKPTALQSELKLAAVSDHVLELILDIDAEAILSDEDFLQVVYKHTSNAVKNELHNQICFENFFSFLYYPQFASGNKLLPGSTPLCYRYGGHQFGVWADQLGDGRAHMLGEYVNHLGERWELQLKACTKCIVVVMKTGRYVKF